MYNFDEDYNYIEEKQTKHLNWFHIIISCILIFILTFGTILAIIIQFDTKETSLIIDKNKFIEFSKNEFNLKQKELKDIKSGQILNDEQYEKIQKIYSNGAEKTVFLTFDDGPSKNVTPLILDLLKQEHIKATFFVLGSNVEVYPNILQREYNEGHFIANHGYSHKYSQIYENIDTILNDYTACENAIRKALNNNIFTTKVYRFPGGSTGGYYHEIKASSKEILKQNHITYLDWNALTYDAEGTPTRESILENLEKTVGNKNTVVLLMHDSSSKILTYETLPDVIKFFKDRNYSFKNLWDVL